MVFHASRLSAVVEIQVQFAIYRGSRLQGLDSIRWHGVSCDVSCIQAEHRVLVHSARQLRQIVNLLQDDMKAPSKSGVRGRKLTADFPALRLQKN